MVVGHRLHSFKYEADSVVIVIVCFCLFGWNVSVIFGYLEGYTCLSFLVLLHCRAHTATHNQLLVLFICHSHIVTLICSKCVHFYVCLVSQYISHTIDEMVIYYKEMTFPELQWFFFSQVVPAVVLLSRSLFHPRPQFTNAKTTTKIINIRVNRGIVHYT